MSRFKKISFSLIVLCTAALSAAAQSYHTPEKGSAERTAILNALRAPVEKELKQEIVFVADEFRVSGSWAFISGSPQTPGGAAPDYSKTPYADAVDSGAFDNNFFALLKKSGGKWKVTTYAIGCTDVCYADWWQTYKATKAVFPYTE